MAFLRACRKTANAFHRREDGAATIEAVLWLPFFLGLFGLLADVSMVFYNQARILRIVQDANRNRSINRLASVDETKSFISSQAKAINLTVTPNSSENAGLIVSSATVPVSNLDLFGVAGVFSKMTLTVRAEHLKEDY